MGAFEFSSHPKLLVSEDGGKVFQMSFHDSDRLMQICELVKRLENAVTVCSYIRPESEFEEMVKEAAKLLKKEAHE